MIVRGLICLLLLTAVGGGCRSTSSTVEVPLSVRVRPAPVETSAGTLLVYELYIERYAALGLAAARVDVLRDSPAGPALKTYSGDELARVLVPPRAGWADAATVLVGFTLPAGAPIPVTLHHTVAFSDGTVARGGVANVAIAAAVVVAPPVRGDRWVGSNGPTTEPLYHRNAFFTFNGVNYLSERFAIDYVKLGADGRLVAGDGSRNEDWVCYGSDLLAVADGTIVDVRDGLPDNQPGGRAIPMTMENLGGNYVVLDIGGRHDRFAFYAHAIPGSLTVKVGDHVTSGQLLGKLGNSGNSGAPHLHFHVCDGSGPMGSMDESFFCDGVPYTFDSFQLLGSVPPDFYDSITAWTPSVPPETRRIEMVARDQVVNLTP